MRRWWIWLIGPGKILTIFLIATPIIWLLNAYTTHPTFWVSILITFLSGALAMLIAMSTMVRFQKWKLDRELAENKERRLTPEQLRNLTGNVIAANRNLGLCVVISLHGRDGDESKLGIGLAGRMNELPVLHAAEALHEVANDLEREYRRHVSAAN